MKQLGVTFRNFDSSGTDGSAVLHIFLYRQNLNKYLQSEMLRAMDISLPPCLNIRVCSLSHYLLSFEIIP